VLEITPVLVYEGGETPFQSVKTQGESVTENNQAISNASGGNLPIPVKCLTGCNEIISACDKG